VNLDTGRAGGRHGKSSRNTSGKSRTIELLGTNGRTCSSWKTPKGVSNRGTRKNEDRLKQVKELQDGCQNQANRRIAERGNGHVSEDDVTSPG
nr:hypothetical protein [Tanacetum cinerariifolium]